MTTQAERIAIVLDVLKAHYPGNIWRVDVAEELLSRLDSARPEPGEAVERVAAAIFDADENDGATWAEASETMRDGYYQLARAALGAAHPTEALRLASELHALLRDVVGLGQNDDTDEELDKCEEKARALVAVLETEGRA